MTLPAIRARNSGQRVKLDEHWNVTRGSVQQFKELQLRVFQSRVRHVVDEREANALGPRGATVHRDDAPRTLPVSPARWNPASINDQWHEVLHDPGIMSFCSFIKLQPCPAPAQDRQECRQCARYPR